MKLGIALFWAMNLFSLIVLWKLHYIEWKLQLLCIAVHFSPFCGWGPHWNQLCGGQQVCGGRGGACGPHAYHHPDRLLHAHHHSQQGWYYLLSKKACQKLLRNLPGSLVFLSRHRHAVFMMHKQYLAHDELESVVIIIIIITSSTSTVMLMAALLLKQAWGSLL